MNGWFAPDSHRDASVALDVMEADELIGREVEIHSIGGIPYHGVVRLVRPAGELGELVELGSAEHPGYRRYVHVVDRLAQIRVLD